MFFLINLHTLPHNDKAKTRFLEMIANVLKLNDNITFTHVFRPFYFVESKAMSLLGYDATSLAHLYLGSFSHPSLQMFTSSVRLDGECRCSEIFRSLQRCSTGFKSGLWLAHSMTFRDLPRSHSCIVLAVCLGSLSC